MIGTSYFMLLRSLDVAMISTTKRAHILSTREVSFSATVKFMLLWLCEIDLTLLVYAGFGCSGQPSKRLDRYSGKCYERFGYSSMSCS